MTLYAIPFSLGAILEQKLENSDVYKLVAYASRSLTEVESGFLQTESEALAVVWGYERFQLFLLRVFFFLLKFELFTYHKALP